METSCIGPVAPDYSPLSAALFDHCAPYIQAALVTAIEASPRKKLFFFWLAGWDLDEFLAVEAPACAWAKAQGCDQAWVTGRRGWLKALSSYRKGATMMVRDL